MFKQLITGLLALFLCCHAFAQEVKIGYIDGVKLIERAPQGDAAKTALEKEFKPREQDIKQLREQIKTQEESLDQNADNFTKMQRELREKRRDLKRFQQELREDLNLRRNEELGKLQRLISNAIIEIAKKEEFDLIIQDAVYASSRIDITDVVLEKLNAAFESAN